MYLSFDSHVGKYSVGFKEDFTHRFTARLMNYLAEHKKGHRESPKSKRLGKLRLRPQRTERQGNGSIGSYMLDVRQSQ